MRLLLSCALFSVLFAAGNGAFAVDYCPLQLQGQNGNSYYYYCQTKQNGNCTYMFTLVGQAYQCGGCCDDCCSQACVNQFSKAFTEAAMKRSAARRAATAKSEDAEVLPVRNLDDPNDKGETYITREERFCTPGANFTVDEVWLQVDLNGETHYFRCFEVTDTNRPQEKLRVGRQLTKEDWDKGPALPAKSKRKADYDAAWPHKSPRFHRVNVNDTTVDPNDDRPFYLISAVEVE